MALGTPTDGGAAYSASGGTSVAPAYPASIASGDCLVLIVGQKPSTANGGTATTPSGWTLRESLTGAGGYGATLGADTGNTNLFIYTKDTVDGTETGNLTVTIGTNNVSWGLIVRIPSGAGSFVYGTADGSRTTAPTSGTAFTTLLTNGANAPNISNGNMAIWAMCIPTDVLNNGFTVPTISSTGTTFGTAVELEEPDSGTGNDIGGYVAYAAATAGSSTAAPTVGVTATGTVTNVRGPIALIRVREVVVAVLNAEPESFSLSGSAATTTATRNVNAEADSYALTGEAATTSVGRVLDAQAGAYSLTGSQALVAASRALAADSGSYSLTGVDATLIYAAATLWQVSWAEMEIPVAAAAAVLDAQSGTYALTGSDAFLTATRDVNAVAGSYAITGAAATLTATRSVNAVAGSYALTGAAATLAATRNVNAVAGSYAITGVDATLSYVSGLQILDANSGSYVLTGSAATLSVGITLVASPANYTSAEYVDPGYVDPGYVGNDNPPAALVVARKLNLETGSFSVTGAAATLERRRQLNAEFGAFNITGAPARLQYPYWPLPSQVVLGVAYGPNGDDYLGTYVDLGIKIDINTGALIKPLSTKTAITL